MKRVLKEQNQSCNGLQKLLNTMDALGKAAGCVMIKWSIRIYKEGKATTRHFDSASYQYRLLSSRSLDGIDPHFLDLYLFFARKREDNTIESEHKFGKLATFKTGDGESVVMTAQGGGTSCSGDRLVPAYLPREELGSGVLTDEHPDAFFQHQTQASKGV